jgi:uncharacterized protein YcbX
MVVTALNIYPIKSVGGIPCTERAVERQGLRGDRRYMVVEAKGRSMTMRQFPHMALVHPELTVDGYRLHAPGMGALELPVEFTQGERIQVTVWEDSPNALVADDAINAWFSQALGMSCRLVFMPDSDRRDVGSHHGQPGDQVSFADGAPLLLTSEASLADLNQRLDEPVSMARFRPNLVVNGTTPYEEDDWSRIAIGECEFEVAWSCSRCILTTVDPMTGKRDASRQPLATLQAYRDSPNGPLFGQNLIPRNLGRIKVGDAVRIL